MQISPRVNGAMVKNFIGRPIRVVGTVQAYDESKTKMQLIASDNNEVIILLAAQNAGTCWEQGQIIEVIGQAQGNDNPTVQEYTSIAFTKGFDLNNYDKLVRLMNGKHSALFQ